ncbi:hypothetical protein Glove_116g54 [Diversispora epigaea]|uniref:MYND-type domain-containing protein n=1 Tax=Diversispora epigaea TaxID=1348612 RepID=A0A397J161_9GLOM|nr:hypothetical protein Glove_116g54 [Diversispora epigaea]
MCKKKILVLAMAASSSTKVVELGFAEPPEIPLTPDLFPSKIGGLPAWLNPEHILSAEQASCGICKKPMVLLIQLYTPEDRPLEAFHRTIYVFCCKKGSCHKISWQKSLKVFRSQLPKDNPYWPSPSDKTTNNEPKNNEFSNKFVAAKTCTVCGLHGSKRCGKCKKTYYCSKEHQTIHWKTGKHKEYCDNDNNNNNNKNNNNSTELCIKEVLFPEYEIISEKERESNNDKDEETIDECDSSEKDKYSKALVPVGDEIYENTKVGVDKAFLKFQKKLERDPDQVLRYARLDYQNENNPSPLWVSDTGKSMPEDISHCLYCNQEKTFEFQILSTLINYLNIDNTQKESLDWGTILVYSCKDNCHVKDMYYIEEFIWRQDFSEDGVNWEK